MVYVVILIAALVLFSIIKSLFEAIWPFIKVVLIIIGTIFVAMVIISLIKDGIVYIISNQYYIVFYVVGGLIGLFILYQFLSLIGPGIRKTIRENGEKRVKKEEIKLQKEEIKRRRIQEHDANEIKKAEILERTEKSKRASLNKEELERYLEKECMRMGQMDREDWHRLLANYVRKEYPIPFDSITYNFAQQMEEKILIQRDDWFKSYLEFIVDNGSGRRFNINQLLAKVKCEQFEITHNTSNRDLLQSKLDEAVKGKGTAPLLKTTKDNEGMTLYYASASLLREYGFDNNKNKRPPHQIIDEDE